VKNVEHVIGDNGGARSILEKDYAAVIRRKLDDVYRNSGSVAGGKGEKAQQENFIVSLAVFSREHDLMSSVDFIERP
jgi:hypothetical protein